MSNRIIITAIGLLLTVLLTSAVMSDTGRAGKTGSPGETTCIGCHNDFASNAAGGSVSLAGISGSYVPGTTYSLSVTVARSGSSGFGFGCEALTAAGANAGTLVITNSTETQLLSATVSGVSRTSVTHKFNGGYTPNTHTFQFNWTAPVAGTGTVTFYFAGLAGDWDGGTGGDYVYNSSVALTENAPCTTPAQPAAMTGLTAVCTGQSQTYAVPAVAGATDYIWSLPSGWTGTSTSNSITVTTGTTSGTVSVAAHNACGTSTARTLSVTSSTYVTPSVSIASSSGTTVCSGASVTFTASPVNGGGAPAYQWRVNGVNVGTNSPTYSTAALANGNTVTCLMTSNALCASTPTVTSNTLTMNISGSVTPAVSIVSGSGSSICNGASVTFTASPVNGGTAPAYQWKVNGVNAGSNSPTFTTSTLTNGSIVSCVMTSNAACASTSTATSNTVTMSVTSSVTPAVNIASGSGTTVCSGSAVTFTASPVNGGTAPAYQWKVNGVNAGSNSPNFITSSLTNGSIVSCVMTSNATCASSTTAASNAISMAVTGSVTPSVSIASPSGSSFCAGTSVTFTATPVNGGPTPSYQWQVNGVNAGTNSAIFTTSTLTNGSTVACVMTGSSACATVSSATSNSLTMTVSNGVTPTISISSASGNTICSGSGVTFSAAVTSPGSSPVYQWMVNNSPVGTNSSTYFTNSLANGDIVSCQMTSNDPCASTAVVSSQPVAMTVTGAINATINAVGATSFCDGGQVILEASSGDTYLWSPGGQTTSSITVSASGSYFVSIWSGSCNATSSATTITVFPNPLVTLSPFAALCSTDAPVMLTGGQPSGGSYAGVGVASNMFDPSVSGLGTFQVIYSFTSADGCSSSDTSDMVVNDCSGQTICGEFVTYETEEWGDNDLTNVVPAYLHANFSSAFPGGLTIGDCGRTLRLTSATAVTDFLPSNGNPAPLPAGSLTDPSATFLNSFAGELVALTLNLVFDSVDATFAPSGLMLKDAVIAQGPFSGWTVMQLYNESNHIIGCVGSNSNVRKLHQALRKINRQAEEGDEEDEEGYIVCPGDPRLNGLALSGADRLELVAFPNPAHHTVFVNFQVMEPGMTELRLYDVTGKEVYRKSESLDRAGEFTWELPLSAQEIPSGAYVIRLVNAERAAFAKILFQE